MDLGNSHWKGEMSTSDCFAELRRLENLLKSVLHRTCRDESEIVWIHNSLLISLKLAVKRCINHDAIGSEFEKKFRVTLQYFSARVGSNVNDLEDPVLILERLLHSTLSPLVSYSDKISTSYVVLLYCLHFFLHGKYDIVLQLTAWISKNAEVIFSEQNVPLCSKTEFRATPLLSSDIDCWKRSPGDIIYLFRILSSLCLINKADYSSALNAMKSDRVVCDVNDEILSIDNYFHALALYKGGNYDEAINQIYKFININTFETLQVNKHLLLALAFSQKSKHQLSMQMLKNCLTINPACHVAILLLSYQYRLLHLKTSEIQTLDLLYEMINDTEHRKDKSSSPLMYDFISSCCPSSIIITPSQILFQLALCHIEIGKYDKASAYFEKFMTMSPAEISTGLFEDDFSFFGYVDIYSAYRKMILSLLKADQFSDVVSLCERILKSVSSMRINCDSEEDFAYEIHIYKARALCGLKDYGHASETISIVITQLEAVCIYKKDLKGEQNANQHLNLLCNAYEVKSQVLIGLERFADAVHYSRMACQICPADPDKVLNLSSTLARAGRKKDGALMWLRFRKYSDLHDDCHIRNQVICQSSKLSQVQGIDKIFLCKDVESLKILQHKSL